jgi:hypothetical protein
MPSPRFRRFASSRIPSLRKGSLNSGAALRISQRIAGRPPGSPRSPFPAVPASSHSTQISSAFPTYVSCACGHDRCQPKATFDTAGPEAQPHHPTNRRKCLKPAPREFFTPPTSASKAACRIFCAPCRMIPSSRVCYSNPRQVHFFSTTQLSVTPRGRSEESHFRAGGAVLRGVGLNWGRRPHSLLAACGGVSLNRPS